jgi:heme exporter protein D
MNFEDFLHMSGYGPYVWTSYGLWLVVLVWNIWSAVRLRAEARRHALRRTEAASTARTPLATDTHGLSEEGV